LQTFGFAGQSALPGSSVAKGAVKMKRKVFGAFALFVFCAGVALAASGPAYEQGQVMVRFARVGYGLDSADKAERAAAMQQILNAAGGGTVVRLYETLPGWALVKLPSGQCVESAIPQYGAAPGIDMVEPDYKAMLTRVPNDLNFEALWAMRNTGQTGGTAGADISATQAWDYETGDSQVVVAVIDSGIDYTHPDLSGNMWVNEAELHGDPGVDDDGNGYIDDIYGYDFSGADVNNPFDGDGDPQDVLGHGTHVAGTIGAVGNNGIGVTGVCWNVRLMALKIAADNSGPYISISDAVSAVEYAIQMGADVMNASWGGGGFSTPLRDAIIDARAHGIAFVAAAGNSATDVDRYTFYPAGYDLDNIISVLATNHDDDISNYSNYGLTSVDIGAPGGEMVAQDDPGGILSCFPGGGYEYMQGTSMAAPHVTGACALLLSLDPALTYAELKKTLMDTADPDPALHGLCVSGGRLNIGAAIRETATDTQPPTPNPSQWAVWGLPKATGPHAVAMQAKKAFDRGAVQYYFECVTNNAFDSGWQSSPLYSATGLSEATQYSFRVRTRDDANNTGDWSVTESATTGSGADTLSPFPDPPVWAAEPQIIRLSPLLLTLQATQAADESGVEYYFEALNSGGTVIANSGWQDSSVWRPSSSPFALNNTYRFRFRVRDKSAAHNTTADSPTVSLTIRKGPSILAVPSHYPTIQAAIDAASAGDIVAVSPGLYRGAGNVDLTMKSGITVRGMDPNNPDVVAATIIDCQRLTRAFTCSGVDNLTTIAGLTIRDGNAVGTQGTPGNADSNTAPGDGRNGGGGGIYCINGSALKIIDCVFDGCFAVGGAGGDPCGYEPNGVPIGASGGSGLGGGIYCDNQSSPLISGCEFTACRVIDGSASAGALNKAGAYGGAMYLDIRAAAAAAVIENCTIDGCSATVLHGGVARGGGIYHNLSGSVPASITGTRVIGCRVLGSLNTADEGGGIYFPLNPLVSHHGVVLSGCQISSNRARKGGGIFYTIGHSLIIDDNSVLSYNSADDSGGAIFAGDITHKNGSTVEIHDSSIFGNWAQQDSGGCGGGICLDETVLTMSNCDVTDNSAPEGAGIDAAGGDITVTGSRISDNIAEGSSGIGGGLTLWNTTGSFVDCEMSSNVADGTQGVGGAMYFSGYDSIPKTLTNCLITGNRASTEGGGLFCHLGAWAKLQNCTVAGNRITSHSGAGGGIGCAEYIAYVELINSIVYGNQAPQGPQLAVGRPSGSVLDPYALIDVSYSDVQGGEGAVFIENPAATAVYFLEGNLDETNPFAPFDVNEPSYYLKQTAAGQAVTSALVNGGSGSAADLEGQVGTPVTTRTDGVADSGIVDIGYHYHATDVLQTYQLTIACQRVDNYDANGVLRAEGFGFDTFAARNEPNTQQLKRGTVVKLTAIADPCFQVSDWTGADNVPASGDPCNTVTMDADKTVTVSFSPKGFFYLFTNVDTNNGHIEPSGRTMHRAGEVVKLSAVPDNPTDVAHWSGTDNDAQIGRENTVTMSSTKYVTVSFVQPRVLYVGHDSQYQTIQLAIDDAAPGDIVMISPGTYNIYESSGGYDRLVLDGKDITITTQTPEDPNGTLVLGGFEITKVTRSTVIEGLTITGQYHYSDMGNPDNPPGGFDGLPGVPEYGGGMQLHSLNWRYFTAPDGGRWPKWWDLTDADSASPTVRHCIFLNCRVTGTNGTDGVAPAADTYFPWRTGNGGWGSWAHGGAVSCGPDSNPLFIDCIFRGCAAVGGDGGNAANSNDAGGAGFGGNWGSEVNAPSDQQWDWGPFKPYWKYSGYGGAVYIDPNCKAEFIRCSFINNTVQGGSCGLSGTFNGAQQAGWPYRHYKIDRFGGAVYAAAGSTPKFVDCNFITNFTDPNEKTTHRDGGATVKTYPNIGYGGAVAFEDGADVILERCNFQDNTADVGAGIYFTWSDPNVTDCNFTGNTANNGGGVLCVGGSGTIDDCRFTANSATIAGGFGGAIACLGANTDISGTELLGNQANGSGGGLYISNKDVNGSDVVSWSMVSVENCLIAGNTAGSTGGGISANWHAFADIQLSTVADNYVTGNGYGGGLYASNGNFATVENSIFWGNTAPNGKQIAIRPSNRPAGVSVAYTDIRGGTAYVQPPATGGSIWVDQSCLFQAGPGNIGGNTSDDPLFVSGIRGDYYLSHAGLPGQSKDSPCIDAGSDSASALGMGNRTTRTDRVPDRGIVDMGYHYPREKGVAKCGVCDLVFDGIIDMADLAAFTEQWLSDGCSDKNGWCDGADFNYDGRVDFTDQAMLASCMGVQDTEPPVPDPMTWRILPYTSSTSISLGATVAYDAWGSPVQYFFECSDANRNSGWRSDPNYTNSGLTAGRTYSYRVKARDLWGNETDYSAFAGAVIGEDTTAPTPNPMTWAFEPNAISNSAIRMVASTATDASGVEYGFWNLTTGAIVWQASPIFIDQNLAPQTQYTYRTAARDKSSNHNTTAWSVAVSATTTNTPTLIDTEPPVTGLYANIYKPAFSPTTFPTQPAPGGLNPVEVQLTDGYYHLMVAATATDALSPPVQYRFICVDDSRFSSGWQESPSYQVRVSSLSSRSSWKWQVQTRDSAAPTPNVSPLSDYANCRGETYPYP
jgi:predicted outer membrane repeat protein